jgi:hypothetical protein
MDKVLGKRPVDLKIKSLSEVTPSVLPKIEIETEFDRQLKKHNPYIHVPKIGY